MNKKEFVAWIESLPEDFECFGIEASTYKTEDLSDWYPNYQSSPIYFKSLYNKKVKSNVKLEIQFSGIISAEFERDNFGNERWCNFKRVN